MARYLRCHSRWLAASLSAWALAAAPSAWHVTRDDHFEIYSQSSDQHALATLAWLEQLRAFFNLSGASRPVRVIVFASEQEYQPYRLQATADAYFVGNGNQEYIVLGAGDSTRLGVAAHEYAHLVLRARGSQFPPWLTEGLAEFLSTLRISGHGAELGGPLAGRIRTLKTRAWIPLSELLAVTPESQKQQERSTADLFYAESWALTEMLALSPKYAPAFQRMLAFPSPDVEAVTRDLHQWVDQPRFPVIQLPESPLLPVHAGVADVPAARARLLLAQLLLAAGEFDRAEASFTALAHDSPGSTPESADIYAGLGAVALHKGDTAGARRAWKRAMEQGVSDAQLCYNYAVLADQAGLPATEIRPALESALALEPDFDDAHYQLALLEKNARNYEAALREFHAMQVVPENRAYAYWLALADTFNELGRRDDAQAAARKAAEHAATPPERARAAQQSYIAQTDPSVQFARDSSGNLQLVTTRVPHQQTDRNPFIEAGDDMRHVQGKLVEIECGDVTSIRVEAAGRVLKLSISDPKQVQMRHAPPDFVCGLQEATQVSVDYAHTPNSASDGIVRGMDFLSTRFESVH